MNEFKIYFLEVFKNKYASFDGRARRAEYWFFSLFGSIASLILGLIYDPLTWLWSIAVFIPSLAILVRRLHDINKSGWCALLFLIPIVNLVLIFVWLCKAGNTGANQYGEDPKA